MKPSILQLLILGALLAASATRGFSATSRHYTLAGGSLPAGGAGAASAHYSGRGHIGPWAATPARTLSAQMTASPSYLGASHQVIRLACVALPAAVNEGQSFQISASAVLDDGSTMTLPASDVLWSILQGPVASIDADGQGLSGHVYAPTEAAVRASYQGMQGDASILVLNVDSDDFGSYAKDGLADDWQVRHFGENNPDALPGEDPDRDGQDNAFEHTAGTIPTDPASSFCFKITIDPGLKGLSKLIFSPVFPDREYGVEYQSRLGSEPFRPLEKFESQDQGAERVVVDLEADGPQRFYRVGIRYELQK